MKKKRVIGIVLGSLCLVLSVTCFICAKNVINMQQKQYEMTYKSYRKLFSTANKSVPRSDLTIEEIKSVKKQVSNIAYDDKKVKMDNELSSLTDFVLLRDKINSSFTNDILNSDTTVVILDEIKSKNKKIPRKYQKLLSPKIEEMNNQILQINDVKQTISLLFTDATFNEVKPEVTRDMYNSAVVKQQGLKQKDIFSEQQVYLDKVNSELSRREELERKRQEEERKRQIAAAWTILDVPYISQNKNNVLNGCEVASLLMGLQYKGYLRNMDLKTYAENVPKSSDPFSGFTYDIYGIEPTNVPHWIAPQPLAKYGRDSSSNNGVIDGTGKSLDELDAQIQAGNPVVIYLTAKFKTPKPYIENAPKNIHVLLLTGYNSITKEQIITDPWTHDDGKTKWIVSKNTVEKIYNATGKRSVIIS